MKLMCDFKRNVALRYVMQKIPIYLFPSWRHRPSPQTS